MASRNTQNQGRALFILGAGATRGCSFVDPRTYSCIPPLDADFFTQLQRVPDPKHQAHIREVMVDVVKLFGHNFTATLETVFATLEHTIRMLAMTGTKRAYRKGDLENMRDRLLAAIAIVMEASLAERNADGTASQTPRTCEHHERLVRDVLQPKDDIISFNYDCVIDYALKNAGDGKWNPRYGYGFNLGPRGVNLQGDADWAPAKPAAQGKTVHLHKLHGSLHFRFGGTDSKRITLKQRPYTKQRGIPRFSIIPPESNKAYDRGLFAQLWKNAAAAVGRAKHVVSIGYSLPPTDLHATETPGCRI